MVPRPPVKLVPPRGDSKWWSVRIDNSKKQSRGGSPRSNQGFGQQNGTQEMPDRFGGR